VAQTWVRVASSAQSRQDTHWKAMGRLAETARWKRRVPRSLSWFLHRLYVVDCIQPRKRVANK